MTYYGGRHILGVTRISWHRYPSEDLRPTALPIVSCKTRRSPCPGFITCISRGISRFSLFTPPYSHDKENHFSLYPMTLPHHLCHQDGTYNSNAIATVEADMCHFCTGWARTPPSWTTLLVCPRLIVSIFGFLM